MCSTILTDVTNLLPATTGYVLVSEIADISVVARFREHEVFVEPVHYRGRKAIYVRREFGRYP
jgi:hypothetical protein